MYQERIVLINSNLSGITSSRVFINEHPIKQTGQYKRRNLRMAEHYLNEFGKLAKTNSTMIIPADLADVGGVISGITTVYEEQKRCLQVRSISENSVKHYN